MQIGLRQEAMDDVEDEEILCPSPPLAALLTEANLTRLPIRENAFALTFISVDKYHSQFDQSPHPQTDCTPLLGSTLARTAGTGCFLKAGAQASPPCIAAKPHPLARVFY
jgi:hypothetical protein